MRNQQGFTLIELLVVISIIGMLSSIVFAALNNAKTKGQFAAAQTFADHTKTVLFDDRIVYVDFDDANTTLPTTATNYGSIGGSLSISSAAGLSITSDTDLHKFGEQFTVGSGSAGVATYIYDPSAKISSVVASHAYTFSAWYKQDVTLGPSANSLIDGVGADPNLLSAGIWAGNATIYGMLNSGGTFINTPTATIKPGQWYQLVASVKDVGGLSQIELFVNGASVGKSSTANVSSAGVNFFGAGGNCCNFRAFGVIDDIAMYSRPLLASEIQQLYTEGLPKHSLAKAN